MPRSLGQRPLSSRGARSSGEIELPLGGFVALLLLGACRESGPPAANRAAPAAKETPSAPAPAPAPAPEPRTRPWSPTGYALNGAQPVWGGSVSGTTIRYMTPEDQFGDVIETRVRFEPEREVYSGRWRGRPFVLTLTAGPCSDGLSEVRYAFAAAIEAGGETRRGCADPQ